jgi:hypothetical protein
LRNASTEVTVQGGVSTLGILDRFDHLRIRDRHARKNVIYVGRWNPSDA